MLLDDILFEEKSYSTIWTQYNSQREQILFLSSVYYFFLWSISVIMYVLSPFYWDLVPRYKKRNYSNHSCDYLWEEDKVDLNQLKLILIITYCLCILTHESLTRSQSFSYDVQHWSTKCDAYRQSRKKSSPIIPFCPTALLCHVHYGDDWGVLQCIMLSWKNLHWPQNKRIGFLFDTKYSQTHQNFQFMQVTGEVVKVPEFFVNNIWW